MLRFFLAVAWIAVTVYAIADWARTEDGETPARLNKQMWILIILVTLPIYSLGSLAWIVLRLVARAEAAGADVPLVGPRRTTPSKPAPPVAPDDDPEFLFRLERDLQRKRREEEARRAKEASAQGEDSTDEAADGPSTQAREDAEGSDSSASDEHTDSDGPVNGCTGADDAAD